MNLTRWRMKDLLDVTCYFISLLMCSTCFGHLYIHHQELATILLEFRCGWVGVVSVLQAEAQLVLQPATRTPLVLHPVTRTLLVLQPATRTLLKPRLKHNLCFNLQHGHYSNPGWSTTCASTCNTDTTQTQAEAQFVLQPATRLKPATRTLLKPNRTKTPTHNEPRTKRPMW